jgi:hypothetical protein
VFTIGDKSRSFFEGLKRCRATSTLFLGGTKSNEIFLAINGHTLDVRGFSCGSANSPMINGVPFTVATGWIVGYSENSRAAGRFDPGKSRRHVNDPGRSKPFAESPRVRLVALSSCNRSLFRCFFHRRE